MTSNTLTVVVCSTVVLFLALEVQPCLKREDLSDFWRWLYPEENVFVADSVEIFPDSKVSALSSDFNGLEDFENGEIPNPREKRAINDKVAIDGYDTDELEPLGRYGRKILNKTEGGGDNKTKTIKELNQGYFQMKFLYENPPNDTDSGNGTDTDAGDAGNGTAPVKPPGNATAG